MPRDRTLNNLTGGVKDHGMVVQANKIGTVNLNTGTPRSRGKSSSHPATTADKKTTASGGAALGALLLIGSILHSCDSNAGNVRDVAFPAEQGTRPAGVDDSRIIALVADKLRLCAAEVVLAPANCPQSESAAAVHKVRWELVGDPADGMQVVWHNDRFIARGTAIMTLTYGSASGPGAAIKAFHFQTELRWQGQHSRVDDIYQPRVAPAAGTIKKLRFQLPEHDVTSAVRGGFAACVGVTYSPMPVTCPRTGYTPAVNDATWRLEADPLVNWSIAPDPEFGLARLTANYSAALHRSVDANAPTPLYTQSGAYVATLVRAENGTARLLDIRHK